ncbi:hypothetical protein CLCR_02443 [Cladophialophora carrionii]|uniref:Uncharacterized protein n=1 Tax=Cladophialophora carrionii TaxID=86049 RepID=A0A1C1CF19_9EURO|nr:hypothetical protein CLCR_02443 [Cladophialophora carrionii]
MSVSFIWQRPGSSDGVRIEASDPGKVLLVKNGNAVEDIWTLNDKKTVRFRQRVPTWDDIIPYSINGDEFTAVVEQGEGLTFFTIEHGQRQDHPKIATTWVNYTFGSKADCEHFQEILYGWALRLLVPVSEICRPHTGRDDDRLVGCENVRVWERGPEMRLMAHLIQERGKRRRKYLEFDRKRPPCPYQRVVQHALLMSDQVCQEGIKIDCKGTGQRSILQLRGVNATIEEFELGRKGSTTSLHSVSSTGSIMRRLSWNQSSPCLDKLDIHFRSAEHRRSGQLQRRGNTAEQEDYHLERITSSTTTSTGILEHTKHDARVRQYSSWKAKDIQTRERKTMTCTVYQMARDSRGYVH